MNENEIALHAVCDYQRLRYVLFFSGNVSDETKLKQLGFKYTRLPLAGQSLAGNILSWCKVVKPDEAWEEIKTATTPGDKLYIYEPEPDPDFMFLKDCQKEATLHCFTIRTDIPEQPAVIAGKYWNHKIYGHTGKWCIYQDGRKIKISDSDKSKLDLYLTQLIDFETKVQTEWD